jgi:tetratricopeptide (TPR) repeat protein
VPFQKLHLELAEKSLGPEHPDLVKHLCAVATLCNNNEEAETLYMRALAIKEKAFGLEHINLVNTLDELACVCQCLSKYTQAEILYKRALEIIIKNYDDNAESLAVHLQLLASMYVRMKSYELAEPLVKRALKIFERNFYNPGGLLLGNNSAESIRCGEILVAYNRENGKEAEARELDKVLSFWTALRPRLF